MTGAVLDRPGTLFERSAIDGGLTLEERLNSVLQAARANGSAECPVCHARMARMTSPRAGARGEAACESCGSRLT